MKNLFKKHIGLIIILIILLVFPTSLSNQARLNMRIIVTGIAVDKSEDGYEVTAQIAKITPGTNAPGTNATIDFITDKDDTISGAISKLSYKAGKVAAFSHTNFVILGKTLLEEDITKCLDYFIRDKFIKNSALLLFAEENAKDEIMKTKNIELSVGLGLQKVYLYKERDGDGVMSTVLNFLNNTKNFSKTATASVFKLASNEESKSSESSGSSGSGGSSSSGEGSGGSSSEGESGGLEGSSKGGGEGSGSGGSTSSQSSSSGGAGGSGSQTQFFMPRTSIMCFVDGQFAGKLKEDKDILGFMLFKNKCTSIDLNIEPKEGKLAGEKLAINIRNKSSNYSVRYENRKPCIDVTFTINNADINEILTKEIIPELSEEDFQIVIKTIKETVSEAIASSFITAKSFGADIFNAYENAYKFHYKETTQYYSSVEDFVNDLKLNVKVNVTKLDY